MGRAMTDDFTQTLIDATANQKSWPEHLAYSGWMMDWLSKICYARYALEWADLTGCLDSGLI